MWHSGGAGGIAVNTPLGPTPGLSKSETTTRDAIA